MVAASICGTDLRILHGTTVYIRLERSNPGHELIGDIEEVGSEIKGLTKGQRFFVAQILAAGIAPMYCRVQ